MKHSMKVEFLRGRERVGNALSVQTSIGDGDHFPSGGTSESMPVVSLKKMSVIYYIKCLSTQ